LHASAEVLNIKNSGPFYIGSGQIPPRLKSSPGKLDIKIDLTISAEYDISCDIVNPNYYKNYPAVIKAGSSINGARGHLEQYLLNHETNKFKTHLSLDFLHIPRPQPYLFFENLDDEDTIYVNNCYANFSTKS
ncbi:TPA: hypothetical protein P5R74_001157, partial [Legionella pneumophila]|nr:hypothetical protein [Legionella pneumophila]